MKKAFSYAGIPPGKVTHASRGVASRSLADMGLDFDIIRKSKQIYLIYKVGRWNSDVMVNSYINHLPWQGIRLLAGFPANPGSFFLPRAQLEPPERLKRKLFPNLDESIEEFKGNLFIYSKKKGLNTHVWPQRAI